MTDISRQVELDSPVVLNDSEELIQNTRSRLSEEFAPDGINFKLKSALGYARLITPNLLFTIFPLVAWVLKIA